MVWFRVGNLILNYYGIRIFALNKAKKYEWNNENTRNILPVLSFEKILKVTPPKF